MREIRGGARKPYASKSTPPKYDPTDEYEPPKERPKAPQSNGDLPKTINVKQTTLIRSIVPGSVWRQRPFKWEPQPFAPESERLKDTIKDETLQNRSLRLFTDDPTLPMIYCVAGTPDDSKAKYFAAYLVSLHLEKLKSKARVVWQSLYGGFDNPLFKDYGYYSEDDPTLIVMSNLSPTATGTKLDKCRDNLERFANIPRIVVVAGEDPFSFMATRLYAPINALAYFSEALMKKRVEVF
jgi:hypothetical protein